MATLERHVPFESLAERDCLLALDFEANTNLILPRPLDIQWSPAPGDTTHPNYLSASSDDDVQLLICDPLPPGADIDAFQAASGLRLRSRLALSPALYQNLTWLAAYRYPRCQPSGELTDSLYAAFGRGRRLQAGVRAAAKATRRPAPEVLTAAYAMLWRRRLTAELTLPLSSTTEVKAA